MDNKGNFLASSQIGELVYQGSHAMELYWKNEEATEDVFRDGWFHSGDTAWVDEEGVVWFVDRQKDLIKSGGENIASIEVERVLLMHPGGHDVAVIGSYQALQHPMAMARARLDAARLMLYRAAALFDGGKSSGTESNMAKLLASEAGFEACDIALQAHGGHGFDRDHETFGLWEGSRVSKTAPINNHMILNYIAEHVLGLPKSYAV